MIQANELRIGNYFWENYGGYKIVAGINNNKKYPITIDAHGIGFTIVGRYELEEIFPIPTTPEILVKLGFEKALDNYGGYLISIGEGEKMRIVDDETIGWHYPLNGYRRPIANYVHQIQNIYFAFTGEELTLKKAWRSG